MISNGYHIEGETSGWEPRHIQLRGVVRPASSWARMGGRIVLAPAGAPVQRRLDGPRVLAGEHRRSPLILESALFIEGAVRLRSWVLTPLCVVAALFLVYVNTKQASRTLSFASEAASEAKLAEIAGGSHLASQRSSWKSGARRRCNSRKIAGCDPGGRTRGR